MNWNWMKRLHILKWSLNGSQTNKKKASHEVHFFKNLSMGDGFPHPLIKLRITKTTGINMIITANQNISSSLFTIYYKGEKMQESNF